MNNMFSVQKKGKAGEAPFSVGNYIEKGGLNNY